MWLFDLDGTLIDSAQDLCNSVNATLRECSSGPLPDPAIAWFVGNGAPMLMRRSLALAGNVALDKVSEGFFRQSLRVYREHKLDFTYAYVADVLKARPRFTMRPAVSKESWPS